MVAGIWLFSYATISLVQNATVDTVPMGVPIIADYTVNLRPQVLFSEPHIFMNDPKGLFRDDEGLWYLHHR